MSAVKDEAHSSYVSVTSQCIFTFHHPFSLSSITFPCISCVHNFLFCSSLIMPTLCTLKHIICSISLKKKKKMGFGGLEGGGGEGVKLRLCLIFKVTHSPKVQYTQRINWSAFSVSQNVVCHCQFTAAEPCYIHKCTTPINTGEL